jgi:hypothetical protein
LQERRRRADDHQDVRHAAGPYRRDDALKDRLVAERQRQLGPAHTATLTGGGNDCESVHPEYRSLAFFVYV